VDQDKRERRFIELVRASKLVPEDELTRSLRFRDFAAKKGRALPLDRILLKFQLLTEVQVRSLYLALRYFTWRKEDKLYAKIAVQSQILSSEDAARCLKEQKRLYKDKRLAKRVNEIAREKGLLEAKEDAAIVEKIHTLKPKSTIRPLASPARAGEEEQWRKDMRARELAELSNLTRDAKASFDDPLELDVDDAGNPQAKLSGSTAGRASDEDLDPLWDEADLDDIELDSGQAEAARGMGGSVRKSQTSEDDEDLFS
jgi:hypothetical protein